MDRISCIAYYMYKASDNPELRQMAVSLLLGDVTLKGIKESTPYENVVEKAEKQLKQNQGNTDEISKFIEEFMMLEV